MRFHYTIIPRDVSLSDTYTSNRCLFSSLSSWFIHTSVFWLGSVNKIQLLMIVLIDIAIICQQHAIVDDCVDWWSNCVPTTCNFWWLFWLMRQFSWHICGGIHPSPKLQPHPHPHVRGLRGVLHGGTVIWVPQLEIRFNHLLHFRISVLNAVPCTPDFSSHKRLNAYENIDYFKFQNSTIKQMYFFKYLFSFYANMFKS